MADPRSTRPRKRPRQHRSRATVEAILDASARILSDPRAPGFDTNRVAALAGVSVGSLYQYFPNKQALVRGLIERMVAQAEAGRPAALAPGSGAGLEEGIAAAVAWHVGLHRQAPGLHRRLHMLAREALGPDEFEAFERRHEAAVRRFLERHRGSLRTDDLDAAAFLFSQLLAMVPDRALEHHRSMLEDGRLEAAMTDMALRHLVA